MSNVRTLWRICAGFAGGTVFIVWVRLGRQSQFRSRYANGGGGRHCQQSFLSKDHLTLDSMACTVWCNVRAVGWLRL